MAYRTTFYDTRRDGKLRNYIMTLRSTDPEKMTMAKIGRESLTDDKTVMMVMQCLIQHVSNLPIDS
ncbi:hypothetical protein C8A03DRAFT_34333 [Achaetomium macrosporum]|uniref:Uncharacterized protein n=1 Tax=Achaetomium macrosporum TaxID=79813 RepID=A0AAN7CAA6_9PEZI|nr:hypothetical protein C8A03DRAFT_34333 [Achaetomium macrosporum]